MRQLQLIKHTLRYLFSYFVYSMMWSMYVYQNNQVGREWEMTKTTTTGDGPCSGPKGATKCLSDHYQILSDRLFDVRGHWYKC
jgi:hypothetical protein